MKEKLSSWGTLMCLAVLTCLLLVHTLAIFPGAAAIRWFFVTCAVVLGRLDAPAWVQAVGSIVAIFVAIGVAMWQRHSDRRAEHKKARATLMVVGAEVDSRVHTLIATATALFYEQHNPSYPTAVQRAKYAQALMAKAELPTEQQMLLLAEAIPDGAATMAAGVAALKRVAFTMDFVASSPTLTTLPESTLVDHYLGARPNLVSALQCLRTARAEMIRIAGAS